ncbi:MAG: helix-turn-helix domain-containing protein [Mycobacterium sp.]
MTDDGIPVAIRDVLDSLVGDRDTSRVHDVANKLVTLLESMSTEERRNEVQASVRRVHDLLEYQRRRGAELSALHDIAVDLARVRNTDEVLEAIVQNAHALIPSADATYLLLSERGTGWSYIKASVGLQSPNFKHIRVQDGHGMVARIYESGAPFWTRNYLESNDFEHDQFVDSALTEDALKSVLGIPLIVQGVAAGILYAANRVERAFGTQEVAVLQELADLASLAIENAQSFEGLRETAREIGENKSELERAARLQGDLVRLVADGGGFGDIVEAMSTFFRGTLLMVDSSDRLSAASKAAGDGREPSPEMLAVARECHRSGITDSAELGDTGWRHVVALSAGNSYVGALVLENADEFTPLRRGTFERAADIVALLALRQQALVEAEEEVRGELLHEILESRHPLSEAIRLRADARGLSLDHDLVAIAVAVPPEHLVRTRRVISEFARRLGGIGGEHNGAVSVVLPARDPGRAAETIRHRLTDELSIPAVVCASSPVDAMRGDLPDSFVAARRCLALLRGLGQRSVAATTREFALYSMLFTPGREHELRDFIDDVLGRLAAYDEEHSADLLATLESFYANGTNVAATARGMYVHHNTIVKRLDRVCRILGPDWQSEPHALRLRIALQLRAYANASTNDWRTSL